MKLSYLATLAFALAAAGLGALAWHQQRELVQLRGAALIPNERAELQKRIWDLEKTNRELSDQLIAARAASDEADLPALTAVAETASPGTPPRRTTANNRGQQQLAMREAMAKPEVQAAIQLQRRFGIEERYAALFRNLNLGPAETEKLKALLIERQNTMQDIALVARDQGVNFRSDPEGFRKLVTDAQAQFNENVRSAVGDAGLAQLQNYEQTQPQRDLVGDLQQRLNYSDTPLTSAQAEQLIQILANNPQARDRAIANDPAMLGLRSELNAFASGFGSTGGFNAGRASTIGITADAINQAQGVLAQPQVEALRQMRAQQQAQQQIQRALRESARPTRSNPAPAAPTSPRPSG